MDIRSFGALMNGLEDGQLLADLSGKMGELGLELVKQAEVAGKAKGEIVLKIKLNADRGGTVEIDTDLTVKSPKPARMRTVLWVDKSGTLQSENPKQTKLPLREAPAPAVAKEGR